MTGPNTIDRFLHVAEVTGGKMRFFRPPVEPALPWTAVSDAAASLQVPSELLKVFIHGTFEHAEFKYKMARVQTEDGPVMIASRGIIEGLAGAMLRGRKYDRWMLQWVNACKPAVDVLTAGMSEIEAFYYVTSARKND